jgi:hypothetical protein
MPSTARQRSAWTSFLRKLVSRYGPGGSFWAENPGVPVRPVRLWQIWNEPNFFYFAKNPSPAAYAKLVKASYPAIKSLDRGAQVLLGGMFGLPRQGPPRAYAAHRFLSLMYEKSPGIKSRFDGIALHPYARHYRYLEAQIDQVRDAVKAHGDPRVPLWITELGWGSGGGSSFEKGKRGQVKQMKGAFNLMLKHRARWRLKRLYWFSLDDVQDSCNFCDSTGLFGAGFKPKPAWFTFTKYAGGRPN